MSSQILRKRAEYYDILETCQKGTLEITPWIGWFLQELKHAIIASEATLEMILNKARFWEGHRTSPFNERQRQMLNRLLDGFYGKLTSSKWANLAKCSQDTALRDIDDLLNRRILVREPAGGRSTSYRLASASGSP